MALPLLLGDGDGDVGVGDVDGFAGRCLVGIVRVILAARIAYADCDAVLLFIW